MTQKRIGRLALSASAAARSYFGMSGFQRPPRRALIAAALAAAVLPLLFVPRHAYRRFFSFFPKPGRAIRRVAALTAPLKTAASAVSAPFVEDRNDAVAEAPDFPETPQEAPEADPAALAFAAQDYAGSNTWWSVQAGPSGKPEVSAYQEILIDQIMKIDPSRSPTGAKKGKKEGRQEARRASARQRSPAPPKNPPPSPRRSVLPPIPAKNGAPRAKGLAGAPRPAGTGGASAAKTSRPSAAAPAAQAKAAPNKPTRPRPAPYRRFRPLLLSRLLGKGALRPPKTPVKTPNFAPLKDKKPARAPGGEPVSAAAPSLEQLERIVPPELKSLARDERAADARWRKDGAISYFHEGSAWGRWGQGHWSWLDREGGRWWIQTPADEGAASAGKRPSALLWHAQHWWWQSDGLWFLLHDGAPWGYRYFSQWKQEGLINPQSGTQMIYSADGSKVALVTPGHGAALFDAATGRQLAEWTEEQMPKRPKPKAPAALRFPAN